MKVFTQIKRPPLFGGVEYDSFAVGMTLGDSDMPLLDSVPPEPRAFLLQFINLRITLLSAVAVGTMSEKECVDRLSTAKTYIESFVPEEFHVFLSSK